MEFQNIILLDEMNMETFLEERDPLDLKQEVPKQEELYPKEEIKLEPSDGDILADVKNEEKIKEEYDQDKNHIVKMDVDIKQDIYTEGLAEDEKSVLDTKPLVPDEKSVLDTKPLVPDEKSVLDTKPIVPMDKCFLDSKGEDSKSLIQIPDDYKENRIVKVLVRRLEDSDPAYKVTSRIYIKKCEIKAEQEEIDNIYEEKNLNDDNIYRQFNKLPHRNKKSNVITCDLCSFTTIFKINFDEHMNTHTGNKPYECEICPFRAANRSTIRNHRNTHIGYKPYQCRICPFRATTNGTIINHMKTHTNEKPYKCDLCAYTTKRKFDLKKHSRFVHSQEKPFSCNLCPFKSVYKRNMNTHILKHYDRQLFICYHCSYETVNKDSLKKHLKTHNK